MNLSLSLFTLLFSLSFILISFIIAIFLLLLVWLCWWWWWLLLLINKLIHAQFAVKWVQIKREWEKSPTMYRKTNSWRLFCDLRQLNFHSFPTHILFLFIFCSRMIFYDEFTNLTKQRLIIVSINIQNTEITLLFIHWNTFVFYRII